MEENKFPDFESELESIAGTTTNESSKRATISGVAKQSGSSPAGGADKPIRLDYYPPCVDYEFNKIKAIRVTSTLMSSLFFKRNPRERCPQKLYHTILVSDMPTFTTLPMQYGSFFEEQVIGRGRIKKVTVLPKLKGGSPTIDERRILEQVRMFQRVKDLYGIEVLENNVQVKFSRKVEHPNFPEIDIYLHGAMDLVSPIHVKQTDFNFDAAVIDIKLTRDRNQEHGEYAWGKPEYLDVNQIVHYSETNMLPGFYLVFDYNAKSAKRNHSANGHKLVPVITVPMLQAMGHRLDYDHPDMIKARQRRTDWKLTVKDTVEKVIQMHNEEYLCIPSYDECSECPLNMAVSPLVDDKTACKYANHIQRI